MPTVLATIAQEQDSISMHSVTLMDVEQLTQEPSGKVRATLAAKIAAEFREGGFSQSESEVAIDIFRLLLKDVEKNVREAMAQQLCHSPHVPRDIITKMAGDAIEVAGPVLRYSQVLNDDDLLAIVESTKEVLKLCVIAQRDTVSTPVADRLVATQNPQVINEVFTNKGAAVSEAGIMQAWGTIAHNATVLKTLVNRGGLPLTVAEKLVLVVSDELKQQLATTYKLGTAFSGRVVSDVREWEVLGMLPTGELTNIPRSDEQAEALVDQLYYHGRLTHSMLIRALCVGCLNIFEVGLARLARVPRVNARILLMNGGSLGFRAIYKASGMPEGFTDAIETLLRISLEETEFGRLRRMDFCKRVIDRIYLEGYHHSVDNMEYLLAITGGRIATGTSVH